MDNKSTLKVSEHVGICQNLLESVRICQNHLKYLRIISEVSLKYFLHSAGIPGGALKKADFVSIRDELFAVTPLESLDAMDSLMPDALDLDESVY